MKDKKTTTNIEISTTENIFFDFIALSFIVLLLATNFMPLFGSIEVIGPQYLYLAFINIIMGFVIYFNPKLVSSHFITVFKNSYVLRTYLIFLILCGITVFTARNFSLAIVNFMQLITVLSLFTNLSILLLDRLHLLYKIAFIIATSIFIESFFELRNFIEVSKTQTLLDALNELKGNTGNINIFAASLTGKIPFLLLGIVSFSKWKKWFLILTLFLVALLIGLTAARASFIALTVEIVIFAFVFIKINSQKKQNYISILQIVLPVLIAFSIANFIFKKSNQKNSRYESITNRITQINSSRTDKSTDARLTYWNNAIQIAKKNPVFGIGLGNWKVESIPYERTYSDNALVSDHPHNDFLEITAETGVLNGCIYLVFFILCLITNLKRITTKNDPQTGIIALIALMLLTSYGIDAFFNFPLYRATMQINFCLMIALTLINLKKEAIEKESSYSKIVAISILILGVITSYFAFCTFKAYQLDNERRVDFTRKESEQLLNSKNVRDRIPSFPNVATNSQPYIEILAIYLLQEKKYKEALKYFEESRKINPYLGRTEWYKYRIEKENGNIDSAYYYAKKAFEIKPLNENFFNSVLFAANMKNDTLGILNFNTEFNKYRKTPSSWLTASSGLANSKYSYKNLMKFIDSGLALFPRDTSLLKRKHTFQNDKNLNPNANFDKKAKSTTNVESTIKIKTESVAKYNFINKALEYAKQERYDLALKEYKKGQKEDLSDLEITQNIGICYFKTNQFKTAVVYLEKVLNSPKFTDGKTEFILGLSYYNIGNHEKGCYFLNLAKNKKYPNADKFTTSQYCK
jgi:O-antigen ligase/Tfp pilus assembly protein PilF